MTMKVTSKYCVVPECRNTSRNAPDKLFISVPSDRATRRVWQEAMQRDVFVSDKSRVHCCEDHFNIQEDIENYMYITTMKTGKIRLKPKVVPRFFDCHKDRVTTHRSNLSSQFLQKTRQQSSIDNLSLPGISEISIENKDVEIQMFKNMDVPVVIKAEVGSKGVRSSNEDFPLSKKRKCLFKGRVPKKMRRSVSIDGSTSTFSLSELSLSDSDADGRKHIDIQEEIRKGTFLLEKNRKLDLGLMTVDSSMEGTIVKVKIEPDAIEIKQGDIASESLDDEFECTSNFVLNNPSSPSEYASNNMLSLKCEPDCSQLFENNDIKLKTENDSSDEFSDDQFIETCFKSEKGTEYGYERCDNSIDDAFFSREYTEVYIKKEGAKVKDDIEDDEDTDIQGNIEDECIKSKRNVKIEEGIKVEENIEVEENLVEGNIEDEYIKSKRKVKIEEGIKVEENIEAEEDINVEEDIDVEGNTEDGYINSKRNVKIEESIKVEEEIEVVEHEIRYEINGSCSENKNTGKKRHGSRKDKTWFYCKHCTYETPTLHTLKRHLILHKDSNKVTFYYCTKCTYKTRQKCHLKRHDLVHQTDTDSVLSFRCHICDFMTKQKCTLRRHIRSIHLNVKREHQKKNDKCDNEVFSCDKCSYTTSRKCLLTSHLDKHKDPQNVNNLYICDICSFSTKYRRNLRVHLDTHRESQQLRNNECKICNFKSKLPYCLKRHLLSKKHLLAVGRIEEYNPRSLKS